MSQGKRIKAPTAKKGSTTVVRGRQSAVRPDNKGTKVAAHYKTTVGGGQSGVIRLRPAKSSPEQKGTPFGKDFDEVFADRLRKADDFYKPITSPSIYEWNFSDVNPAVHAFATRFLHCTTQYQHGETDLDFLKLTFNKLLLNFTWWVNRKDGFAKHLFEGGFLGLDISAYSTAALCFQPAVTWSS